MRSRLRRIEYAGAMLLFAAMISGGAQASPIAQVTSLVNAAFRSPPGEAERAVQLSDQLVQDEAVRTEADATVELGFIDGSQMSLEPESELVLSKYVFDPEGKATAAVINLQSGTFHYTSNGVPDQNVVLKTPVATIGIRGTELLIFVGPSIVKPGETSLRVDVISGKVDVDTEGGGTGKSAEGGQSVSVKGPNNDLSVGDIGDVATAAGAPPSPTGPAVPDKGNDAEGGKGAKGGSGGGGGSGGDPRP
jgi:hypothetical protein